MTGACKGTGRIKIRLNEGETEDSVRANFSKAGWWVSTHVEKPAKNSKFSGLP